MTYYIVHCEQCGDLGKPTTIKQRAERNREVHVCATGHHVDVMRGAPS